MQFFQSRTLPIALLFLLVGACTKSKFKTATELVEAPPTAEVAEQNPVKTESTIPSSMPSENISEAIMDGAFKGGFESKALVPNTQNHVWIATANGIAQHLTLENGAVKSKKAWSGLNPAGGTRTYVLEGGAAIMAKNGGAIYFLHDGVAEGAINVDPTKGVFYQLQGVAPTERTCVVSYRKNGKRMIGMAWGLGNFAEVEQEEAPPYGPKFATITAPVKAGPLMWGYSCYIDQARLQFYSQYFQGATQGLDLKTMLALDLNKAPNVAFASTNLPNLTLGAKNPGTGSYAMAGDRIGNVFNGVGFYTMAFEAKNAMVWGTSGTNLTVLPHECLYKTAECKGFASYNLMETIGAGVGPLSALGDGSMVGMVRTVGDVYLFKLKVPTDATKGIDAVKIVDKVGGDPYMYTDFTGATLYLNSSLNEFDFSKSATKFDPALPIRQLAFSWSTVDGGSDAWKDIKTEIRCYADPASKGAFQELAISALAKANQLVDVASCKDKLANRAEVQLTQLNNSSSLMGVAKIQITAFQ